jgi:2-aminoethylphosphonate-pyruvate transaminase
VLPFDERGAVIPKVVDAKLAEDPSITHVILIHCETGAGVLNPLPRWPTSARAAARA